MNLYTNLYILQWEEIIHSSFIYSWFQGGIIFYYKICECELLDAELGGMAALIRCHHPQDQFTQDSPSDLG